MVGPAIARSFGVGWSFLALRNDNKKGEGKRQNASFHPFDSRLSIVSMVIFAGVRSDNAVTLRDTREC